MEGPQSKPRAGAPRVELALCVYNGERFVDEALHSLRRQTYRELGVLVSDNASTDRTQAICERHAAEDPRIKYVRQPSNLGAAGNFKWAFARTSSEYFTWAHHDDIFEPTMVERCVELLDRRPDVVLVYPRTRVVDASGRTLGMWTDALDCPFPQPHRRLRHFFLHRSRLEAQHGLFRRDVVAKTGLFGGYPHSDQVFMAEMILHGPFAEVADPLFCKRHHASISTEAHKMHDLASYLDTRRNARLAMVRLERLSGFVQAIVRADLDRAETLRCLAEVGRMALVPGNLGRFGEDVAETLLRLTGIRPLPSADQMRRPS